MPFTRSVSSTLLKKASFRLLKKIQMRANYKDESGNLKAKFSFQLS